MTTVDVLEGVADLPHRRLGPGGIDREGEQVAVTTVGGIGERVNGGVDIGLISVGPQLIELCQLGGADFGVLDLEDLYRIFFAGLEAVLVDTDHRLLPRIDAGLCAGGGLLDAQLRDAGLDRSGHAAHLLDLGDVRHCLVGQFIREPLDMVAPAPRSTVRVVPLSCCRNSWVLRAMRAEKSVGSASASSRALVCSDWVCPWVAAIASTQVRVTLLNTSWAVSDHPLVWLWVRNDDDLGFFGSNWAIRCDHSRRAAPELGDLHEEVHPDRPEEAETRRKRIDVEAGCDAGPHVFHPVGQRVGQLEIRRRSASCMW